MWLRSTRGWGHASKWSKPNDLSVKSMKRFCKEVQEDKKDGQQSEPEAQTGLNISHKPNVLINSWVLILLTSTCKPFQCKAHISWYLAHTFTFFCVSLHYSAKSTVYIPHNICSPCFMYCWMTAIACGSHVPVQEENKTTDVIILKLYLLSNRVSLFPYAVEKTFCMQAQLCGTKCKQPVASLVLLAGKKCNTRGCTACFPIPLHFLWP